MMVDDDDDHDDDDDDDDDDGGCDDDEACLFVLNSHCDTYLRLAIVTTRVSSRQQSQSLAPPHTYHEMKAFVGGDQKILVIG